MKNFVNYCNYWFTPTPTFKKSQLSRNRLTSFSRSLDWSLKNVVDAPVPVKNIYTWKSSQYHVINYYELLPNQEQYKLTHWLEKCHGSHWVFFLLIFSDKLVVIIRSTCTLKFIIFNQCIWYTQKLNSWILL